MAMIPFADLPARTLGMRLDLGLRLRRLKGEVTA